jgi:hypothetical protein
VKELSPCWNCGASTKEGLRPRLRAEGAELPLDGFTAKLGGTDAEPGLSGLWIEAYIDQAMAERVIDPDQLDEAA